MLVHTHRHTLFTFTPVAQHLSAPTQCLQVAVSALLPLLVLLPASPLRPASHSLEGIGWGVGVCLCYLGALETLDFYQGGGK